MTKPYIDNQERVFIPTGSWKVVGELPLSITEPGWQTVVLAAIRAKDKKLDGRGEATGEGLDGGPSGDN